MKRLYRKGENSPAIRFLSACKRIREHAYAPYLIATGCAAAGFLAQWYGQSHYEGAPFITLYPAVVAATLFGGFAAGLFAAALDGVAQWLWFIPVAHWLAIATYVADALICVALIDFINRSFDLMLVLLRAREARIQPPADARSRTASSHPEPLCRDPGGDPAQHGRQRQRR